MEKQTLGSFLAALRKASGMTQRELAEKLNVSDKAVSRWERDECAPDLTLIPIIADLFGVTADELLRGARSAQPRTDAPAPGGTDAAARRRIERILKANETRYTVRTLISLWILIAGILVFVLIYGLYESVRGILTVAICLLEAILCQTVFTILAFSAVPDGDFDPILLGRHRRTLLNVLFAFCTVLLLPLLTLAIGLIPLNAADDASSVGATDIPDSGTVRSVAGVGAMSFPAALLLLLLTRWLILSHLGKTGFCAFDDRESRRLRLKTRIGLILLCTATLTLIGQLAVHARDPFDFTDGQVFESAEAFKEFIETPVKGENVDVFVMAAPDGESTPNPSDGSASEYTLYDSKGNLVLRCDWLNGSVILIRSSEDGLPVTVYTEADLSKGLDNRATVCGYFDLALLLEGGAAVIAYFILRRKSDKL